ncbi:hypothetical protein ACVWZA_002420 [Sphingomonas sp. UYAg733]
MAINRTLSLLAVAAGMLAAVPAYADITFYGENGCRGPVAFRYAPGVSYKESCKANSGRCRGHNDVARSMKVTGTSRPSEIRLYDDPGGSKGDDYSVIQFRAYKAEYPDYCVSSFERSGLLASQGQILYTRKNGLDGKVSYVIIYR